MITPQIVRHVADLARLHFDEAETAQLTEQLGAILGYVEQLNEVATEGVEPTAHPVPNDSPLRPDVVRAGLSRDEVLQNAPLAEAGMFQVPRIHSEAP